MTYRYLTLKVPRYSCGTTLVELLIAMTLSLLLFGLVGMTLSQGFSAFRIARNNVNAQEAGRVALERIATVVRGSAETPSVRSNGVEVKEGDGEELIVTRRMSNDGNLIAFSIKSEEDNENELVGYDVQKVRFSLSTAHVTGSTGPVTGAVKLSLVSQSSNKNSLSLATAASPRCITMAAALPPAPEEQPELNNPPSPQIQIPRVSQPMPQPISPLKKYHTPSSSNNSRYKYRNYYYNKPTSYRSRYARSRASTNTIEESDIRNQNLIKDWKQSSESTRTQPSTPPSQPATRTTRPMVARIVYDPVSRQARTIAAPTSSQNWRHPDNYYFTPENQGRTVFP